MSKQLEFFHEYQRRLTATTGEEETQVLVNKALVLVSLGGNDFVNNYFFTPVTLRRLQYNLHDFSLLLISEYKYLQKLYDLGARRVLVTGTGPLGCIPTELAARSANGQWSEEPQKAAAIYNPLLVQMISDLNQDIGSDVFVAVNAKEIQNDFINKPQLFGFITSKVACCGQGPYNGLGICIPTSNLCPNRDLYAFWDSFHPTEKANRIIVRTIFTSSEKHISSMNLSIIMELDARI